MCEVAARGRFLVAERIFEDAEPLSLGPRSSAVARPGELVAVEAARGRARVVERLGSPRDIGAVLRGLVLERGVGDPFPDDALAEARAAATEPDGLDDGRDDLRDLVCFTVDPPGAKDFDDAIGVVREGDGLRAFVHIADVSWHVRRDGPLDLEARRRELSVYVPGRVEPMLPHELSSGACSLQEGRDRRAVTVEVPFDAQLRPGPPIFRRSLIRSRARLTYQEAHDVLSGQARHPLGDEIALADSLARELRGRRMARGALSLDARELEIELDGPDVVGARLAAEAHAHALVEELMLLANEAVATHLAATDRPTIYRVHEPPEPESIEALVARFAALGVPTVALPESLTPDAAAPVVAEQSERLRAYLASGRPGRDGLTSLLLRSLKQARYDPRNLGHAGLASPAYCHFTSPIRRYPDLVAHRALLATIGQGTGPGGGLDAIAEDASLLERAAADVEHAADDICLAWLLADRRIEEGPGELFEGEITGLIGAGLFVRFGEVFEGFVPSRRLARGDRFETDELGVSLVGQATNRAFRIGEPIEVAVTEVQVLRGRVTLELAGAAREREAAAEATRGRGRGRAKQPPARRPARRRRR